MTTPAPSWVLPLRAAATGQPPAARMAVEIARGTAPPWFAGDAVHAVTSCFLAALVIAAAHLRTGLSSAPFDLIALLLRTASVAFAVRALIALWLWGKRLASDAAASEHALVWSDDGLYWRAPGEERWLSRRDVAGLVVPEARRVLGSSSSLQPLYVVARPADTLVYWALPPYFAAHAELLSARLERWRQPTARAQDGPLTPPLLAPDPRYERAAQGRPAAGELVVPEGFGYRLRAPYGVLLALVFVADALYGAGTLRERLLPAALLAALLAPGALLIWFGWMRRRRAVRLGIALVLTREELLLRGKQGVVSVPWTQLEGAEVLSRLAWSPLVGSYLVHTLWFYTLEGTRMPFDGGFLGVPPEVVATLANGYRAGSFADTPASDTQGSGAGGGISATAGATTTPATSS